MQEGNSRAAELVAAYEALTPEATRMQPEEGLEARFIARGREQWAYGEVTLRKGCPALLATLLDGTPPEECTLLDIGSGVGQLVLYASAVARVRRAIGIELVPSRHAVGEAARSAIDAGCAELHCGDALSASELHCYEDATHIFMANAIFPDELTASVVRHAVRHAPHLRALALLKEPPADALVATGLVLARAAAVDVSWLSTFGWPLFVYVPRAQHRGAEVIVDDGFDAARENQDWFSMC